MDVDTAYFNFLCESTCPKKGYFLGTAPHSELLQLQTTVFYSGLSLPGQKGQKGEPGGPVRFSRHSGRDNIAFSVSRRNILGPVTDDTRVMFDQIYSNLGDG